MKTLQLFLIRAVICTDLNKQYLDSLPFVRVFVCAVKCE